MRVGFVLGVLGWVWSTAVLAFPCFITLVKDACWAEYTVTMKVLDASANKTVATIVLPKGKNWGRVEFSCVPQEKFLYLAQFTPAFWQGTENTVYKAQEYISVPATITAKESAWNLPVCFPKDFSGVPMPPTATAPCTCDFSNIPPVPPQPQ